MTTEVQRHNVEIAARAIAPLAAEHSVVVVHGNGPQVGLLSLQAEAYAGAEPYPLDVLDAGTQGMIGYLIQQELRSVLSRHDQVATLLTMIVVDADDPAFAHPTKFVVRCTPRTRPTCWRPRNAGRSTRTAISGGGWFPHPSRGGSSRSSDLWLLDQGSWSSVPAAVESRRCSVPRSPDTLTGVEAVIDKDLAGELVAREVDADLFVMATDVDGVYVDWGTPNQRQLVRTTPEEFAGHEFAAGSMGPKIEAACRFVRHTDKRAAIGSLNEIAGIVGGESGTNVVAG